MSEILELTASYGQIGALLWLVYELRDIRRWMKAHLVIYHNHKTDDL